MKKILTTSLAVLLAGTSVYPIQRVNAQSIPSIQTYQKTKEANFNKSSISRFAILKTQNYTSEEFQNVVKLLQSEFAEKQLMIDMNMPIVLVDESQIKEGDIVYKLDSSLADEEYKINVDKNIQISAKTARGILYGGRSVLQYLLTENKMQYGEIDDKPVLKERSFHIDIARKFYTKDWIIDRIKEASWLKLNTVQLHFSENEGFRIESKTHPEVMSKEYITQAELKEILAVAKKYHVDVIPSLDSPGHLRQVLNSHPEYRLKGIKTGLDITNPQARSFIKELYAEYAELFKESTHFHIGGDEFIDFNKFSSYPALERYAKEVLHIEKGTGIDTYIDFVNEIATFVESKGFITRVWNDGFHRVNQVEHVKLKDSIEITYWTRWDRNMAKIDAFIKENRNVINFNDAYFYYVLGELAGYKYPTGEKIYTKWSAGDTPSIDYTELPPQLSGASFSIWSDSPKAQTQEEVAAGIKEPLAAMAERSWNNRKNTQTYEEFAKDLEKIGEAPQTHPLNAISIVEEDEVSKVTLKFVDKDGNKVQDERVLYGNIGGNYDLTKFKEIYGYKLLNTTGDLASVFAKENKEVVLSFEKVIDLTSLEEAILHSKHPESYLENNFEQYNTALEHAKTILFEPSESVTQLDIDEAVAELKRREEQLISINNKVLYDLLQVEVNKDQYTKASYAKYLQAKNDANLVLHSLDQSAVLEAYKKLADAYVNLVRNDAIIAYLLPNEEEEDLEAADNLEYRSADDKIMMNSLADGDTQTPGGALYLNDQIQFDFKEPKNISKIKAYPVDNGYSELVKADLEISIDGTTFKKVGELTKTNNYTFEMEPTIIKKARVIIVEGREIEDTGYESEVSIELSEIAFFENADKTPLQEKLKNLQQIVGEQNYPLTKLAKEYAIALANESLTDKNTESSEIERAIIVLDLLFDDMKLNFERDTTDLENLIAKIKAYDLDRYEEESTKPLYKALILAQAVINDEFADNNAVQKAYNDLEEAVKLLKEKQVKIEKVTVQSKKASDSEVKQDEPKISMVKVNKDKKVLKQSVETSQNAPVFMYAILMLACYSVLRFFKKK